MDTSPQNFDAYPTGPGSNVTQQSQLHSPMSSSVAFERAVQTSSGSSTSHSGPKRKRTTTSRLVKDDDRKKVSRACDTCKSRKVRCSGTQPCTRCVTHSVRCEYIKEHRRGKPLPQEIIESPSATPTLVPQSQQLHRESTSVVPEFNDIPPTGYSKARQSTRSSQEPEETRFEGHYIGPISGISFLQRAHKRFRQDFDAIHANDSNGKNSQNASVFTFGDGYIPDPSSTPLVFPSKLEAKQLLDRYFDFAVPTYRFLHRETVEEWLEEMMNENEPDSQHSGRLSDGKAAVILCILATAMLYKFDMHGSLQDGESEEKEQSRNFFAAAERKLSSESGHPRLESVQARLAQCLYLLGSSRINQAWYIFGTTCQIIVALGLHRKRFPQAPGTVYSLVEIECRKRAFWSCYTLDAYFSVILGRPRNFRDEDIDQCLPERLKDADLTLGIVKLRPTHNQCISDAPVFHARLARIIGKISSDLYPANGSVGASWIDLAEKYTVELKSWKEALPAFLEPDKVDPSILIPIFQRQSTVLRLAYAHAMILANRQALLTNFADLNRRPDLPNERVEERLTDCIDAAFLVVDTVNGFIERAQMFKAFWFTHYISFCAITTIYVYTMQRSVPEHHNELIPAGEPGSLHVRCFEAAERCQRSIAATTARTSPFRRYNIILDELKKDVLLRISRHTQEDQELDNQSMFVMHDASLMMPPQGVPNSTATLSVEGPVSERRHFDSSVTREALGQSISDVIAQEGYDHGNVPFDLRTGASTPARVLNGDPVLDFSLFGPYGELVGWSEFDSCVSLISNQ
ncbi:hypothetical protein BP6252_11823 [Coleophoma cylindrospora]|uniref:Zn(2)-C6 fungal-type domain-containing protein n=1 Tax=Coleophoma cylindrospora TaxID=1849047 RepID=A0A3D8QL52_9HELO|nr:hypothetical protein BP6252_11823 [Coleophoma cylindrospora]